MVIWWLCDKLVTVTGQGNPINIYLSFSLDIQALNLVIKTTNMYMLTIHLHPSCFNTYSFLD